VEYTAHVRETKASSISMVSDADASGGACELVANIGAEWRHFCFGVPADSIMLGTVQRRGCAVIAALLLNEATDRYEQCLNDLVRPLHQESVERALGVRDPSRFSEQRFRAHLTASSFAPRGSLEGQFVRGFRRGLRQRYHARFATRADHEHWLYLARSPIGLHRALAEGYSYALETPIDRIRPDLFREYG